MNSIKTLSLGLGLATLGAVNAMAQAVPSAFASAVDFTAAGVDVNYVGAAVIVFSLGIIGFWIVYKLMHSAKRA